MSKQVFARSAAKITKDMMTFPLNAPESSQILSVQTGTWGDNAVLLVSGKPVPPAESGAFVVPATEDGKTITVRLKTGFLDTVPVAYVNDRAIRLLPPLALWDYLLLGLPLGLLLVGGALGGIIGAVCAYGNVALFRGLQAGQKPPLLRYALPLLVTLGAVALHRGLLFAVVGLLHTLTPAVPPR